jgi:hypothetical protein
VIHSLCTHILYVRRTISDYDLCRGMATLAPASRVGSSRARHELKCAHEMLFIRIFMWILLNFDRHTKQSHRQIAFLLKWPKLWTLFFQNFIISVINFLMRKNGTYRVAQNWWIGHVHMGVAHPTPPVAGGRNHGCAHTVN